MNRQPFEKLLLEHLDALYRMAIHLTRNPEEAADLVQDTYLRAIAGSASFQDRGSGVRPWLFTILHNCFYTSMRRQSRELQSTDDLAAEDTHTPGVGEAGPAWNLRSLDWQQVDGRLKQAIDRLTPEHRVVLLLWGVEDLTYREIALILGVPIGTVMSRLHRARLILCEMLEEFASEMGYPNRPAHQAASVVGGKPSESPKSPEQRMPPSSGPLHQGGVIAS